MNQFQLNSGAFCIRTYGIGNNTDLIYWIKNFRGFTMTLIRLNNSWLAFNGIILILVNKLFIIKYYFIDSDSWCKIKTIVHIEINLSWIWLHLSVLLSFIFTFRDSICHWWNSAYLFASSNRNLQSPKKPKGVWWDVGNYLIFLVEVIRITIYVLHNTRVKLRV